MTAGNNGTPEPENDDPFAYLYRGEGDEAASTGRPGVPRTSYHQVSRVGERRPSPQQQAGYGYQTQPVQGQTQAYPQQTQGQGSGYGEQVPPQRGGHGSGRGIGGNNRNLMIGAIAVVAAVAIGIGAAMLYGNNGGKQPTAGQSAPPSSGSSQGTPTASANPNANLPEQFAASLTLSGGAKTNNNHKGAQGTNGVFVDGMDTPGASAQWTAQVPKDGSYTLWVRYANADPAKATSTVVVNGKPLNWKINLADYGQQGDWDQWFTSYVTINLTKGSNVIALTCGSGDTCNFNLDRVGLTTDPSSKPTGWS